MGAYRKYSGSPVISDADRNRFWSKVVKCVETGCWLWTGCKDDKGYGLFKLAGRMWKAQRVAWMLGADDPGPLMVLHHCDTPACVNYEAHLFLGTHSDNMKDCAKKGRLNTQNGRGGVHIPGLRGCVSRAKAEQMENSPQ